MLGGGENVQYDKSQAEDTTPSGSPQGGFLGFANSLQTPMKNHADSDSDSDEASVHLETQLLPTNGQAYREYNSTSPLPDSSAFTVEEPKKAAGGSSGTLQAKHLTGIPKTYLTFFKSFVGPGILFLPKGFANAGLAAGLISFTLIAFMSNWCLLKLIDCKVKVSEDFRTGVHHGVKNRTRGVTYGMLGRVCVGRRGRWLVDFSIFVSQIGFAGAGTIFIAKNLRDVMLFTTKCDLDVDRAVIIALLGVIYIPLVWVRYLKYFAISNLIADALIIIGLVFIYIKNFIRLGEQGPGDYVQFDPVKYWVFLGTALYTMEGMALILPIHEAMKDKPKCPQVTRNSISFISLLLMSFGAIGYLTFGKDTLGVITLNLEADHPGDWSVSIMQIGYCIAVALTFPIQMFPAIKIAEIRLFKDKKSLRIKWKKNILRTIMVIFTCAISIGGADKFDNFVALIGGLACVPLALIYPTLFHLRLFPKARPRDRAVSWTILVVGCLGACAATFMSIYGWITAGPEKSVECDPSKLH